MGIGTKAGSRRGWIAAALALAIATGAYAQERAPEAAVAADQADDKLLLIGMTPEEAYAALGAPVEVFAYRGAESRLDDVVFYFTSNLYVFWYGNRIWQVRADGRYGGTFLGLRMGWNREQVVAGVGRSYQEVAESLVFFLPDASLLPGTGGKNRGLYPLRLRAFFQDGKLADLYLYRGDF
jgi:hypothetical protein